MYEIYISAIKNLDLYSKAKTAKLKYSNRTYTLTKLLKCKILLFFTTALIGVSLV